MPDSSDDEWHDPFATDSQSTPRAPDPPRPPNPRQIAAFERGHWGGDSDDEYVLDDERIAEYGEEAAEAVSPEDAIRHISDLLIDHWTLGKKLTSNSVCILCFWMKAVGVGGSVAELALGPGKQSGKYRPHIRKALGLDLKNADYRDLKVPCADKIDGSRVYHTMPVVDPHVAFSRELADDPSLHEKLAADVAMHRLPPLYTEHPVAQAHSFTAFATFLYVDGTPTTKRDGVVGFWTYIHGSTKRHLNAVVRKRRLCGCGCKGWCTFYVIFQWLHWSYMAMACGYYPSVDSVGNVFLDDLSSALAETELLVLACLCGIKGDWSEFTSTFGFSNWKTLLSPCMLCWAIVLNMFDDQLLTLANDTWPQFTSDDYEMECRKHEITIIADRDLFLNILRALYYDRRKNGSRGRALRWDIAGTRLLADDRLEPSDHVSDVMEMDTRTTFPTTLTFWRPSAGHNVKHRNPLFDKELGIVPSSMLTDSLHALNLGAMKSFAADLFWRLLLSGVWSKVEGRTQEEFTASAVEKMRSALVAWQDKQERANPEHKSTRIQDITPAMVGTPSNRVLALKAAETKYFFLFLTDQLVEQERHLPQGGLWAAAANELAALLHRMDELPWKLETPQAEETHPTGSTYTHSHGDIHSFALRVSVLFWLW